MQQIRCLAQLFFLFFCIYLIINTVPTQMLGSMKMTILILYNSFRAACQSTWVGSVKSSRLYDRPRHPLPPPLGGGGPKGLRAVHAVETTWPASR
jgi:hypothetical protein